MSNLDWSRWPHFKPEEFACSHCGKVFVDRDFMDKLEQTRVEYGAPIFVTSGYRCPEYNNEISSTGTDGPHTTGKAVDIHANSQDAHRLLYYALKNGFSGVGVNQKGANKGRFIHLDTLDVEPRPNLWSY